MYTYTYTYCYYRYAFGVPQAPLGSSLSHCLVRRTRKRRRASRETGARQATLRERGQRGAAYRPELALETPRAAQLTYRGRWTPEECKRRCAIDDERNESGACTTRTSHGRANPQRHRSSVRPSSLPAPRTLWRALSQTFGALFRTASHAKRCGTRTMAARAHCSSTLGMDTLRKAQ